jgi:hypothetical protein
MIQMFRKGSKSMKELRELSKKIQQFHLYRWGDFAQSSAHGEDCRYAKATIRAYAMDNEAKQILEFIQKMRLNLVHLEAIVMSGKVY